ncbi:MAG TPA: S8 family serine peptidase [Polyangiaceae bacterium]
MKLRGLLLVCGVTALSVFAGGAAKADSPSGRFLPSGEPLVWMDNCPFDAATPHAMLCLSRRLVPKSVADARAAKRRGSPFTNPPDSGGLDASSAIGTCNGNSLTGSGGTPSGLGPTDYIKAYNIPSSPTGAGKVVAIVDACGYPNVLSDLAAYRSQYGLPAIPECGGAAGHAPTPGGSACIGVISQRGGNDLPTPDDGWAGETALDVDMVSAACPDCSILLVQADSPNSWDLGPAVSEAVSLGASAVSNSYGAPEDPNDPLGPGYSDGPYVSYYQHPGTLITVASGDALYDNQSFQPPATVPSFPSTVDEVLSIGGTTMTADSSARGYNEVVWSSFFGGTTSGCSSEFSRPAYQTGLASGSCTARADVDVAAVADNVASYGGGWNPVAGTSCASPLVAAIMTRLGLADRANDFFYANGTAFYDVTSGNNDPGGTCTDVMCNAGTGWDGPTGWGTPNGVELLGAPGDAGLPPVDAGVDAGPPVDAGAGVDAGSDAGVEAGGGDAAVADAGMDAAMRPDAIAGTDAGMGVDASRPPVDASSPMDATAGTDANGGPDAAGSDDSGFVADSGAEADGGNGAGSGNSSGCGCATIGASPLESIPAGLSLIGLGVLVARRRRRS